MVSNAREDLPDPDRPVKTMSRLRGSTRSMCLRLCSAAPLMTMESTDMPLLGPFPRKSRFVVTDDLRAPVAHCQRVGGADLSPVSGGRPQRVAAPARSRGFLGVHLVRMARLEVATPRCGLPRGTGDPSVRLPGTDSPRAAHRANRARRGPGARSHTAALPSRPRSPWVMTYNPQPGWRNGGTHEAI